MYRKFIPLSTKFSLVMSPSIFVIIKFELQKSLKSLGFWLIPLMLAVFALAGLTLPPLFESSLPSKFQANQTEILVIEDKNILDLQNTKQNQNEIIYTKTTETIDQIKQKMKEDKVSNLLVIQDLNKFEFFRTADSAVSTAKLTKDLNQKFLDYQIQKGLIQAKNVDNLLISTIEPKIIYGNQDRVNFINFVGYLIAVVLFFVILMFGSLFMNQIIVEKNSKVYEIILTSISTQDLFVGKYVAFLIRAVSQILISILGFVLPAILFSPVIFSKNISSNQTVSDTDILNVTNGVAEISKILNPVNISVLIGFSILGVILYSGLMSLIGSCYRDYMTASNSPLSFLLTIPVTIPLFLNMYFADNPNVPISVFFQLFPLTSPIAVTSFIFNDFSWTKIILAFILLIFSIWLSFKIAIKVYLEGALSDGNIDLKKFWKIIRN